MRNHQATLIAALLLGAGAVTTGCGGSTTEGSSVGSSQARLVMAVHGDSAATLHVTASDDASAAVVVDQTVDVNADGAAVIDLALAPSSYTFHVAVIGGPSGDAHLGDGSVQAVLQDGETTEIQLSASVDGSGDAGSAKVQVGVDTAPKIAGVHVEAGADGTAQIHVDATDADGDALAFFWSGAGVEGAVEGSATLSLSAAVVAALSAGAPVVHVVVQDAHGATAAADVTLTVAGGSVGGTITASQGSDDASVNACLQAHASCSASCDVSLDLGAAVTEASCIEACTLSLAACEAN